jgi:hypothetical protein
MGTAPLQHPSRVKSFWTALDAVDVEASWMHQSPTIPHIPTSDQVSETDIFRFCFGFRTMHVRTQQRPCAGLYRERGTEGGRVPHKKVLDRCYLGRRSWSRRCRRAFGPTGIRSLWSSRHRQPLRSQLRRHAPVPPHLCAVGKQPASSPLVAFPASDPLHSASRSLKSRRRTIPKNGYPSTVLCHASYLS